MKIVMNADRNVNEVIIIEKTNPCANVFAARYLIGGETEIRRAEGQTWKMVVEEIEAIVNFKLRNDHLKQPVQPREAWVNDRMVYFFA